MARNKGSTRRDLDDADLVARMQSILINAAEGRRSLSDDRQYPTVRRDIMRRSFDIPPLVITHPSIDSFVAYIKGIAGRAERVRRVRDEFRPLLGRLLKSTAVDTGNWTGISHSPARFAVLRNTLPLARDAVDGLMSSLAEAGGNGGPPLDERLEAIEHLRQLHRTLSELLDSIDEGHLNDDLGEGLAAEASRYAKRAARALKDDPMPYISSGLLLALMSACGFPGIGGYLSGIALQMQKSAGRRGRT